MNRAQHPSDDPGHPATDTNRSSNHSRHKHSGVNASSQPRRPGTGERQSPRVYYTGDHPDSDLPLIPGEVVFGDGQISINKGMDVIRLEVRNIADRPIQVGSHYHFAEVNHGLDLDRKAAWGRRLNVLSGGSVRFEPGALVEVELVPIAGKRIVTGLRGECAGRLDARDRA